MTGQGYNFQGEKAEQMKRRLRDIDPSLRGGQLRKLLTTRQMQVYRLLCSAASSGLPCPSNRELGAGHEDAKASGSAIVGELVEKGYIAVHRRGNALRRIEIADTGELTDWARRDYPSSVERISLTPQQIADARDAAERKRREREDFWLRKEAETYGLPRKGRPISEMPA